MQQKKLIVIVGATAVGKTSLCVALAKSLDTVVVSADSRQFFKEMQLGTAKPTEEEMDGIPHYFVNTISIHQPYNVGKYEVEAIKALESIFQAHDCCILTGGSGLYIDAVCEGIDTMPLIPGELRDELNARFKSEGLAPLVEELREKDPEYYNLVDTRNPQRVIRALEVCRATGNTFTSYRTKSKKQRFFKCIKIGLERDRDELYDRIDRRMDIMIDEGLFEEAEKLYPHREHNALQTVGYKEIFDFMDGEYDKSEAVRLLKRNSRRYAKRQMTWFKRDADIKWFHPDAFEEILGYIQNQLQQQE